jgi:aminobenzoyl-glutamate utilization protein B
MLPLLLMLAPPDLPAAVDARADATWDAARRIWGFAEGGYLEKQSSALLADQLEQAGFAVNRGVAGMPTAFTATFGAGKPVLAVLGEYDALPELSQEAVPVRQPRPGGTGFGHACGHHLFGAASATACIALAGQLKATGRPGTVRFYGCPAEEGGAGKVFLVRDGLFADVDVALHWHPSSRNAAGDRSCLARVAAQFRFHGKPSHAAGAPERGRSALDALLLTMHAVELLREHTPDGTRLHHTVTSGGGAANVVPEFAEGFFYVRHPKSTVVAELWPRLVNCAKAGALATDTRLEVRHLGGTMEILPNQTLGAVVKRHLTKLNDLSYDAEETKFAVRLQETFDARPPLDEIRQVFDESGKVGMGSTDVGDVSWVVPTTGFGTATWVPGTPGHSWQAVACGRTTVAKKGMMLAAKTLAAAGWEVLTDPAMVAAAKAEFAQRKAGRAYRPILEPGQPPPLDYRLGRRAGGE